MYFLSLNFFKLYQLIDFFIVSTSSEPIFSFPDNFCKIFIFNILNYNIFIVLIDCMSCYRIIS